MPAQKLTDKKKLFVKYYCVSWNGTQAAIEAGYSEKTAAEQASRLLRNVNIQEAIQKYMNKLTEEAEIEVVDVLDGLKRLAFLDIRKLYNDDGSAKKIHELDDDIALALAGIDVNEISTGDATIEIIGKKYKLSDRTKALELLGKYLKMFTDKIDITSKGKEIAGFNITIQKDNK